jgi:putative glycosyltransferase (TIGR04348 family)
VKIALITPAPSGSRSGNRITAVRWAGILKHLGHQVQVLTEPTGSSRSDLMIAIHAWRSAQAVRAYKERNPAAPLVVLLSGTDIYHFQHTHPESTLASLEYADRLVGLHDRVALDIPARYADKLRIIYQSCQPLSRARTPVKRSFLVCVVGHLRQEKDPLRAAFAARQLNADSRLRVIHLGGAHTPAWAAQARAEQARNPRYAWRGEVSPGEVRRWLGRCHAMVMSSVMEGGANVVSEAVVAGLPVLASDISGNLGLLGEGYPGYFPVGDENALAKLLSTAETDPSLLASCCSSMARRAHLFEPDTELERWRTLLDELVV